MPAIPAIIMAGSAIGSAVVQSRSANKASQREEQAAREALDFEKEQYYGEQERLAPYRQLGSQAYQRMGKVLGLDTSGVTFGSGPMPGTGGLAMSNIATAAPLTFGRSRAPVPAPNARQPRGPASGGAQPRIGDRKTFPNGRQGEWDGRGWQAVG